VRARLPAPHQHEQEHNTQQHPPSLNLDIPAALLRPCLFDGEATDDAALPIHRHSYKRQATCKKGTEYGARAKGALLCCVHPACRAIGYLQSLAPGKVFMRRDYLRSSMLSLARWLTALARWCRDGEAEGSQAEGDDLSGRSQAHRGGTESQVGKGKGQQVTVTRPGNTRWPSEYNCLNYT
jgi:hypothetical protein